MLDDLTKKCIKCDQIIVINENDSYNTKYLKRKFCSFDCKIKGTKLEKIYTERICKYCGETYTHYNKGIYCSRKCALTVNKPFVIRKRNCLNCQIEFIVSNDAPTVVYCSNKCFGAHRLAKYKADITTLDDSYIIGMIWATGLVINLNEVRFYSSLDNLIRLSDMMESTYKILPTRSEVFDNYFKGISHRMVINNSDIVDRLIGLGLDDPLYREWPWISVDGNQKFLEGYISMVEVKKVGNEVWIWMVSKTMAYEVMEIFGMGIIYDGGSWWCIRKKD